jgi:hypothetical protein
MLGSLGLIQHLQGVALGASAADIKKRASKLPEAIRAELDALLKKHRDELKAARDSHGVVIEEFFTRNALPKRMSSAELAAAKKVVAAFINGERAKAEGIESTGSVLKVGGKVVGERSLSDYKRLKICPGNFGESALSRKAANAALSILGAGIGVVDRDGGAFLAAGGRGGRIYSPNACYTVQVNARLEKAAQAGARRTLDADRDAVYGPGGELEKFYAGAKERDRDRMISSRAVDGLRRGGKKHRRKHR